VNIKKRIIAICTVLCIGVLAVGCAGFDSDVQELKGSIKGCTYHCMFFDNHGDLFMTAVGENISLESNIVEEDVYNDGSWGTVETLSSVITITIDGKQMESCGSTAIFAQDSLVPDAEFEPITNIESESTGSLKEWTSVAGVVNEFKNYFGKSQVVVIQSQLGDPICAYSGDNVYWEVCEDLPKTTKLMIDGKALYIHRANFQIIDKALLN
jgi:hypothetical protein